MLFPSAWAVAAATSAPGLVVDHLAVAPVAVDGDQDLAARVDGAEARGLPAEPAEDDGVDDAQARAGEHGDGQLGGHREVDRDAVAGFEPAEVP